MLGFIRGSVVKHPPAMQEMWVGQIPWRRKRQPLQYSWLGNPSDKGTWLAAVHGVTNGLDTTQRLNNNINMYGNN